MEKVQTNTMEIMKKKFVLVLEERAEQVIIFNINSNKDFFKTANNQKIYYKTWYINRNSTIENII